MKNKSFWVYILTNWNNRLLYIGITSNLVNRTLQDINKENEGFTSKYNINKLVYYEHYDDINFAIQREKQLKKWKRDWKFQLIKMSNPKLLDLFDKNRNEIQFINSESN